MIKSNFVINKAFLNFWPYITNSLQQKSFFIFGKYYEVGFLAHLIYPFFTHFRKSLWLIYIYIKIKHVTKISAWDTRHLKIKILFLILIL